MTNLFYLFCDLKQLTNYKNTQNTVFEFSISQSVCFVFVALLEFIHKNIEEISPFRITDQIIVVIISLSENVFNLGIR